MNEITRDLAKGKQANSRYKIIMASLSRFVMNLRIFFSIVGILSGLSAVFVFGIKFNNWNAALWGLLSGLSVIHFFIYSDFLSSSDEMMV